MKFHRNAADSACLYACPARRSSTRIGRFIRLVAIGFAAAGSLLSAGGARAAMCPAEPMAGCYGGATKAQLSITRDENSADRSSLRWKWLRGAGFDRDSIGTPWEDTSFSLCLYDASTMGPLLVAEMEIPPSIQWLNRNAVVYRGDAGITSVTLLPGAANKTKVMVKGRGAELSLPAPVGSRYFEQSPLLVLQLVNSAGNCWTSVFREENTASNTADARSAVFSGKGQGGNPCGTPREVGQIGVSYGQPNPQHDYPYPVQYTPALPAENTCVTRVCSFDLSQYKTTPAYGTEDVNWTPFPPSTCEDFDPPLHGQISHCLCGPTQGLDCDGNGERCEVFGWYE